MLRALRPRLLLRPLPQPRLLSTTAKAGAATPVKRTPGSVKLPPPPPAWRMALRLSTIAVELAAMKLRHIRNVPINIRARKMRETFIRLGPAFVKAGQALATRPDAGIPAEVCAELSKLQDQMPPFSTEEAHAVIEAELGAPVEELFQSFSATPVAAASLGQVYRGRLWPRAHVAPAGSAWASTAQQNNHHQSGSSSSHNSSGGGSVRASKSDAPTDDFEELGLEVAVKVQRPGLGPTVLLDAHVLRNTAKLLQATLGDAFHTDFVGVTDQLVGRILEEMDYRNEAAYADQFGALYRSSEVRVPYIVPSHSAERVLTMEWVTGTPLAELALLSPEERAAAKAKASQSNAVNAVHSDASSQAKADRNAVLGLDPGPIIEVGVRCSLAQLLEHGYYHGDPHPGNLLVTPKGELCYLDYGMMGVLPADTRTELVALLVNFVNKDEAGLADDFLRLGFLPPHTELAPVEEALRAVFEASRAKAEAKLQGGGGSNGVDDSDASSRMDFRGAVAELSEVLFRFRFRVPPHFALVIRALGALEGTVIRVDPNFKVVARAYPYVLNQVLRDKRPQMRKILASLLVDRDTGRVRWARLQRIAAAAAGNQANADAAPVKGEKQSSSSGGSGSSSGSGGSNTSSSSRSSSDSRSGSTGSSAEEVGKVSGADVCAAVDDALYFLLSPSGGAVRRGLVADATAATEAWAESVAADVAYDPLYESPHQEGDAHANLNGSGSGNDDGSSSNSTSSSSSSSSSGISNGNTSSSGSRGAGSVHSRVWTDGAAAASAIGPAAWQLVSAAPKPWLDLATKWAPSLAPIHAPNVAGSSSGIKTSSSGSGSASDSSSPTDGRESIPTGRGASSLGQFAKDVSGAVLSNNGWQPVGWALTSAGRYLRDDHRRWQQEQQKRHEERKQ